ncbi:uncharacterized protein LOC662365 [Tribolium castaneum]|uniref:uncharacterized protein LOC662365 n=1 Tax=Tribolium castaneum TaxID=7070 RepID=UPI0030FE5AC4
MIAVMKRVLIVLLLTYFQPILSKTDQPVSINFRHSKFWPVGVVRFPNTVCNSLEGYTGTCYTKWECHNLGGVASGSCANGIGTCCIFQGTCGGNSSYNNTYFTNRGFPNTVSNSSSCTFTIKKCNSDICQVRLDFLNLNLAQPDGNGNCITDSLIISGGASNLPIICGQNSGEHVYINFNGDSDIILMIATGALTFARSWNIKITQLACDCPSLAPTGCLMYYTALSGTVNSFNYGTTLSGGLVINPMNMTRPGTRQLANENYGVCVQMQPGYCAIEWSQGPGDTSFTVSNDTAFADASSVGLPGFPVIGTMCNTDFVVIPNPIYANGTTVGADRFCGNQLPTVISSSKPFVLTVVTDENDVSDVANRGFSLTYRQIPCGAPNGMLVLP